MDVLLRPEGYALDRAVPLIRLLNFAGLLALAGAIAILAHRAYADISAVFRN